MKIGESDSLGLSLYACLGGERDRDLSALKSRGREKGGGLEILREL